MSSHEDKEVEPVQLVQMNIYQSITKISNVCIAWLVLPNTKIPP